MKGYRFFAEMSEERGSKSGSKCYHAFTRDYLEGLADQGRHHNCIAVPLNQYGDPLWVGDTLKMDAYHTGSDLANGWVSSGLVERGYLRTRCVRISAALARKLHPRLFFYLESP